MRILKISAIAVGALIGIVLIAAVILILRFDPNDYKPQLTALLEERSGRSVVIADDIEWSLFPWLAIETGGIEIGNHPAFDGTAFATIDSLSARVRVWPLLRRQVELGLITVDGFTLDVGTNADGTANWSDLLGPATADGTAAPDAPASGGGIAELEIAGVRLANGRILWRELGEVRYVISDAALETGPIALGEPVEASLELEVLDVASQRRGRFAAETVVALAGGDVRLDDLTVDTTVLDVNGNTRGTARLVTEQLTIAGERVSAAAGSIEGNATDPPFGPASLAARIAWPSFELDAAAGSVAIGDVTTEVNGITATWTVTAENLATEPAFRGRVAIPAVSAERLLATAGIEPPAGIDAAAIGTLSGGGGFAATAAGDVRLDDFTLELLGMTIGIDGGVSAGSQLRATLSIPRFQPNAAFRSVVGAGLPDPAALDAVEALSLDASATLNLETADRLSISGLRLGVDDATLTADVDVGIADGSASGYTGTLSARVPEPALLQALLGESFPQNLQPDAIGPTTLTARFSYTVASDALSVDSFDVSTFGLEASGGLTANSLRSAPVVRGRGTLARFDPRAALARLGQPSPQTSDPNAFRTAAFTGEYVIDAAHAEFRNMSLDIDDMRITGSLSVEDFESPSYRFDLATDTLDVDRYLPPTSEAAEDGERTAGDIELANEPLERLDLVGSARVGNLMLANLEFQQVATTLTIGSGRAEIAPARTRLYGGEFDGSLAVDTNGESPTMRLTGRATALALEPLVTALTGESNVRGTGNFDLDLTGAGATVTEALHTAAGTMSFSLTGGAIDGFNLGRTLCAAYNLREKLPQPAAAPDVTEYDLIRASADVSDGIAASRDVLARTSFMEVTGGGRMNLGDARIDYDMVAALTAPVPIGGCETMTEFVGDSIPFTIDGPLSEPDIQPDLRKIIRSRVQEEVRDRVEDRLRDRLQDRLKDLL